MYTCYRKYRLAVSKCKHMPSEHVDIMYMICVVNVKYINKGNMRTYVMECNTVLSVFYLLSVTMAICLNTNDY